MRISTGRVKEGIPPFILCSLPPPPPPSPQSHGMESGRLRAGGDTKTYKSREKNKQMDRHWQALGFFYSCADFRL